MFASCETKFEVTSCWRVTELVAMILCTASVDLASYHVLPNSQRVDQAAAAIKCNLINCIGFLEGVFVTRNIYAYDFIMDNGPGVTGVQNHPGNFHVQCNEEM